MFVEISSPRDFALLFPLDVKSVDTIQKPFEYFHIRCKVSSCVNGIIQWIICLLCVGRFTVDIFFNIHN